MVPVGLSSCGKIQPIEVSGALVAVALVTVVILGLQLHSPAPPSIHSEFPSLPLASLDGFSGIMTQTPLMRI